MFVWRRPDLLVLVNHKPLVNIFLDKALEDIKKTNPRLFSLNAHVQFPHKTPPGEAQCGN